MLTNAQAAEGVAEQIKATGSSESTIAAALELLFDGWILPVRDAVLAKKLQEQILRYEDLFSVALEVVCLGSVATVAALPVSPDDSDCYFSLEAEAGFPNGQFYVAIDGVWVPQGDSLVKGRTGTGVPESGATEGDVLYYSSGGNYWDTPAAGSGDVAWGAITGTLSGQTDLQSALDAKLPTSYLDTDTTLAANSDSKVATQKATKAYVDALIAANDAMVFKGVVDCSANPNYPAADRGWTYRVSVAGKIGGASGVNVQVGDVLICTTDSTPSGNQATVGTAWGVIQVNIDGALTTADIGSAVQAYSVVLAAVAALTMTNDNFLQIKAGAISGRTIAQVRTDLGISNVDNTSDAGKPISTATQTALDLKINTSDIDTTVTLGTSDTKVPSQKAVKTYVDAAGGTLSNTTATSAPTVNDDSGDGYAVGSRWYWPARGRAWVCLSATVGAAVWKPDGVVVGPGYVSGRYYTADAWSRSSSAMVADRLYATLVVIRETVTIDQLAIRVGTAAAATTALLGIYSSVNGLPGDLIAQGTGSTSTASNNTTATVSFSPNPVLTPGVYWLAALFSGTPSVIAIAGATNQSMSSMIGSSTATEVLASAGIGGPTITQAYGSGLPSTFGTPTGNGYNTTTALVAFRVA